MIDGFALMSYAPVIEPFRAANRLSGKALYVWKHYSPTGSPASASNGISFAVDSAIAGMEATDILFVCAGGNPSQFRDATTLQALRRAARFGTTVAGVSGGPFILARAGLLDGVQCTIHWEHEEAFLETFDRPRLERGLFVIDGNRVTCAGGIAGLDLAVVLIARDHGAELADKVSDWYIQTEQRQAGRSQRHSIIQRYRVTHSGLVKVLATMEARVVEPLGRDELAVVAGVSVRQLDRLFRQYLGSSIARHAQALKLELAYKLLVETTSSVAEISAASGFASQSHFSRSFTKKFGVNPTDARAAQKLSIARSMISVRSQ
ncbi:GlxA family transcriptional regulator [Novosphingobium tardum]|uniref:GlxA family transcriptional regulator n=1 Tax=Novosphingobium tardum TaxID=1538021 RepID=A0ABV8RRQ3_9SPHN